MKLSMTVTGTPQPKGSRVQVRPGCNIEDGTAKSRKRKKAWRDSIEREATERLLSSVPEPNDFYPIASTCVVAVHFYIPIPKSRATGKKRLGNGLPHAQKPDIDKLLRAVLDPLTRSGLIKDDSLVCELTGKKFWCQQGEERAEITLIW